MAYLYGEICDLTKAEVSKTTFQNAMLTIEIARKVQRGGRCVVLLFL
jgi:hypothetical protein